MTEVNYTKVLADIAALGQADFDTLAMSGNTVLATGHFGDDFKVPTLNNGWALRLLPAGKEPNWKQLIIQPGSTRAKDIWRRGQVALAKRSGLNDIQAEVWAGSRLPRRHELLARLGEVVQDPRLVDAYRNYSPEGDYKEWSKSWGVKDGLSPTNRKHLVDQINMVLEGEKRANNPINKKLKELQDKEKKSITLSADLQAILNNKPAATAIEEINGEEQPKQLAEAYDKTYGAASASSAESDEQAALQDGQAVSEASGADSAATEAQEVLQEVPVTAAAPVAEAATSGVSVGAAYE